MSVSSPRLLPCSLQFTHTYFQTLSWRTLASRSGPLHSTGSPFVPHTLLSSSSLVQCCFKAWCSLTDLKHNFYFLSLLDHSFTFWRDLSTDNLILPAHRLGTVPTLCSRTAAMIRHITGSHAWWMFHQELWKKRRKEGRKKRRKEGLTQSFLQETLPQNDKQLNNKTITTENKQPNPGRGSLMRKLAFQLLLSTVRVT